MLIIFGNQWIIKEIKINYYLRMDGEHNVEKKRKRWKMHIRRHLESGEKQGTNRDVIHGHMIWFEQRGDHRGEMTYTNGNRAKTLILF